MFELQQQISLSKDGKAPQMVHLQLALLACENHPPYGPPRHTAQLFLELLHQVALLDDSYSYEIRIHVYNVIAEEYPTDWKEYQGFILPGSFAAAYNTDPWILNLRKQLQTYIVANERPTLAVCFGHQIMAHSFFPDGQAGQMPHARAGRYEVINLPDSCVGTSSFSQFFSHGDQVEKLPKTASAWGSSDPDVPVQIAAYYGSSSSQPYCISFQAHPEYATEENLGTLLGCMDAMKERNALSTEEYERQVQDAHATHGAVKAANLEVMRRVVQTLGWFPTQEAGP
jgi:GMP synthase-like glutamine amidotransferase